ncbi:putative integral membrane protein [Corynebacterium epidermidicanis]|uniref:Putative integral membrane protein n=1 Tax=Corynebacterium epidermidicanis TaxID=1050174 RepID=A0A0G3GXI9_9CORY|nr:putative integral membrane protein [Corynebacterium epidermidicanis]
MKESTITVRPASAQAKDAIAQRVSPARTEPIARGFIEGIGGPLGRFAAPGTQSWWTPLRVLIATALTTLSFGFLSKANCIMGVRGDAGVGLNWSGNRQFVSACYNDIVPIFGHHGLDKGTFPYAFSWVEDGITRYMEYPVLTGLFQWVCALIANALYPIVNAIPGAVIPQAAVYFWVTALVLSAAWVLSVKVVSELAGNRVWDVVLMAASPLVISYAFSNWDILPILCAVSGLLAVRRNKQWAAGVWFGIGAAFKLWPIFLLGAFLVLALRNRRVGLMVPLVLGAAISWLLVNLPIMIFYPAAWNEFFRLNSTRGAEWTTVYALGQRIGFPALTIDQINLVSFVGFALSCVAIAILGLRSPHAPRVAQLAFLIVAAFLLWNKVWSPQYSLWLVPLAVLALPNWRLLFTWMTADALLWPILCWHMLGEDKLGAPGELLNAAIIARDGTIIAIGVLIVATILGKRADKVALAHEGRDPLAGPFARGGGA